MFIRKRNPLEPVGGTETPENVFFQRRGWLKAAGFAASAAALGGVGYFGWRRLRSDADTVIVRGQPNLDTKSIVRQAFPAKPDGRFTYGRPETERSEAARYTNFYEFSKHKGTWQFVDQFQPYPWTLTVDGLCRNPLQLDLEQFHQTYARYLVERQYRHRCVERWAMAVPWTGIPLGRLLRDADPLPAATHVRFVSFRRPDEASNQQSRPTYPWPYREALTLLEGMADLTLLATGIYGRPLLKQHGAPIRLVVPWKYGYKSIKSIERIELIDHQPATFWNTLKPRAYPFESNVDPLVPCPWPQQYERMLGSGEKYPTQYLNGYRSYVGHLYRT